MNKLIEFINDLATDLFYEKTLLFGKDLFQRGACYELFLIVNHLIKDTELYIHKTKNHVVIKYGKELYDSTGKINNKNEYRQVEKDDLNYINEYFGEGYRYLKIKDTLLNELDKIDISFLLNPITKQKVLK